MWKSCPRSYLHTSRVCVCGKIFILCISEVPNNVKAPHQVQRWQSVFFFSCKCAISSHLPFCQVNHKAKLVWTVFKAFIIVMVEQQSMDKLESTVLKSASWSRVDLVSKNSKGVDLCSLLIGTSCAVGSIPCWATLSKLHWLWHTHTHKLAGWMIQTISPSLYESDLLGGGAGSVWVVLV